MFGLRCPRVLPEARMCTKSLTEWKNFVRIPIEYWVNKKLNTTTS